jgi:hypothetical protein
VDFYFFFSCHPIWESVAIKVLIRLRLYLKLILNDLVSVTTDVILNTTLEKSFKMLVCDIKFVSY